MVASSIFKWQNAWGAGFVLQFGAQSSGGVSGGDTSIGAAGVLSRRKGGRGSVSININWRDSFSGRGATIAVRCVLYLMQQILSININPAALSAQKMPFGFLYVININFTVVFCIGLSGMI